MKFFLLRVWAVWRRFRRGAPRHYQHLQYAPQVEALMRKANPFASWSDRANWMISVAEWLRREPKVSLIEDSAWRRVKHRRTRYLLDWLDAHRDVRRVVQATLQKTLREAVGPELFYATGMAREPAFFSELLERLVRMILPRPPVKTDLSTLFTAMFPDPADADWLLGLDAATVTRLWKLAADDTITHNYRRQIDEALLYLVTMVISTGISPAFRERLQPTLPLQATPFMSLRRELEKYLAINPDNEGALRGVRMLIAVCQAQTDKIYEHLDEYGVSVSLVYHVERMRSQLTRMARLIGLRAASSDAMQGVSQVQSLLVDLINAHHRRSSVRGLVRRSFSLIARKMVERNADRGEPYIARDRAEYRAMLRAACGGGAIAALTVLGQLALPAAGPARFFEGLLVSLNYAASFLMIFALGAALGGRQPAVIAPALAARMTVLDTADGVRSLLTEIAALLRSQAAAVLGNLSAVIPTMLVVSQSVLMLSGSPLIHPDKAHASIKSLSIAGATPLFAAVTGVLLWIASLAAGVADNWFALRGMRETLMHHRRLVQAVGVVRAERWAKWLERNVSGIVGNLSLAALLGLTPAVAHFFGLPLDIRHVTLSAGMLTAAASSLGWNALATPEFWLAFCGMVATGLLNVGVAFGCALALALHARDVPARMRRLVLRSIWRRFAASPLFFLLPERHQEAPTTLPGVEREQIEEDKPRRRRSRG